MPPGVGTTSRGRLDASPAEVAGGPLDVLFEAGDLPRYPLAARLRDRYGGEIGFPAAALYANFVSSLDGIVALDPSTPPAEISLHTESDRFVMALLRACAEAVVIGVGTLRAEPNHIWTPGALVPEEARLVRRVAPHPSTSTEAAPRHRERHRRPRARRPRARDGGAGPDEHPGSPAVAKAPAVGLHPRRGRPGFTPQPARHHGRALRPWVPGHPDGRRPLALRELPRGGIAGRVVPDDLARARRPRRRRAVGTRRGGGFSAGELRRAS